MDNVLTEAVVDAIKNWPFSRRALARAAGVSHTTLQRLLRGDVRATPATAQGILTALEESSAHLGELADRIRSALGKED